MQAMGRMGYWGKKRPRKGAEMQASSNWHSSCDQIKTLWAFPITVFSYFHRTTGIAEFTLTGCISIGTVGKAKQINRSYDRSAEYPFNVR